MKKVILKFPWPAAQDGSPYQQTPIFMPQGAEILRAATQHGAIALWALCVVNERFEERRFHAVGTGWEIEAHELGKYIGTVDMHDGRLVWHLFELPHEGSAG